MLYITYYYTFFQLITESVYANLIHVLCMHLKCLYYIKYTLHFVSCARKERMFQVQATVRQNPVKMRKVCQIECNARHRNYYALTEHASL